MNAFTYVQEAMVGQKNQAGHIRTNAENVDSLRSAKKEIEKMLYKAKKDSLKKIKIRVRTDRVSSTSEDYIEVDKNADYNEISKEVTDHILQSMIDVYWEEVVENE